MRPPFRSKHYRDTDALWLLLLLLLLLLLPPPPPPLAARQSSSQSSFLHRDLSRPVVAIHLYLHMTSHIACNCNAPGGRPVEIDAISS
jgi:hypothetical protein